LIVGYRDKLREQSATNLLDLQASQLLVPFSLVVRSAASGRVRNHNDEPDELLRRMT
jgi:hypothetical protein